MKNLTKAMTIILLISLLFSCSENSYSSKEKIRIFVSWPGGEGMPHYQWKKGEVKPTGIEPTFIERVLEIAELDYEYITDYDAENVGDPRIESIVKEEADISIRGITINEARKKQVLFTNSYYTDGLSALVRKSDSLETVEDLVGKKVYALEFTTAYPWAKENLKESAVLTYSKYDTNFIQPENLLLKNEIDAYIIDKSFLNYIVQFHPELGVMSSKFTEENIGIAVSKNKPELVEKLNRAMKEMRQTGEFDQLLIGLN
ncbi:MAG: ABC transporter substrate-binding protein [Flavobacteriales bacterium]